MTMRSLLVAFAFGAVLSGCVENYANREIAQGAQAAILQVANAPQSAVLYIDGREVGSVAQFAAGAPLTAGRHDVVIRAANGQQLHAQAVYATAGAHVEVRVP